MKLWWITSLFWLVLFVATAIFIGVRKVDGSGLEQTPELRIVAFIVLGFVFVFILLFQLLFLYFARKSKKVSIQ
ncbi:DUF3923 family protein [Viridibacillus sp. NPDC093762]|uniref:DUF3923 family protein n=1 Tax=Viridibacillus sp. NPDC093762 TaxID=3390720 RepID=UPI003CFFDD6A